MVLSEKCRCEQCENSVLKSFDFLKAMSHMHVHMYTICSTQENRSGYTNGAPKMGSHLSIYLSRLQEVKKYGCGLASRLCAAYRLTEGEASQS